MRKFTTLVLLFLTGCGTDSAPPATPPPAAAALSDGTVIRGYRGEFRGDGTREFRTQTRDGRVLRISAAIAAGADVTGFLVEPSGEGVAMVVAGLGLYVSPLERAAPVLVSQPGEDGFSNLAWSPDGALLAYTAGGSLHVVAPDGSGHRTLAADVSNIVFWAAGRVCYRSDAAVAGQSELWSVRGDGTDAMQLTQSASAPGVVASVDFRVSPDGTRIAALGDAFVEGERELLLVDPAAAFAPVHLSTEAGTTDDVFFGSVLWSPDSSQLLYRRQEAATGFTALCVVSATGGDARIASTALDASATQPAWSPDGAAYAYFVGPSLRIGDVEVARHERITGFEWAPDGSRVAYVTTDDLFRTIHLRVVDAAAAFPPLRVTPDGFRLDAFDWAPAPQLAQQTLLDLWYAGRDEARGRVIAKKELTFNTADDAGDWEVRAVTRVDRVDAFADRTTFDASRGPLRVAGEITESGARATSGLGTGGIDTWQPDFSIYRRRQADDDEPFTDSTPVEADFVGGGDSEGTEFTQPGVIETDREEVRYYSWNGVGPAQCSIVARTPEEQVLVAAEKGFQGGYRYLLAVLRETLLFGDIVDVLYFPDLAAPGDFFTVIFRLAFLR